MINTLKLLVRANLGNSTYHEVEECYHLENDEKVHEDWWVVNTNSGEPVLVDNTLEEAEIYCGLCNLLDTSDYDTLTPYLKELLPQWFEADEPEFGSEPLYP